MDDLFYETKLKATIAQLGLSAEHRHFTQSCHSVADAAAAVGAPSEDFVKNVGLFNPADASGNVIICIVKGEDKVDKDAAAKIVGATKLKTATPELMLEKTGYPVGGTPSFGYDGLVTVLVDERIMEKPYVWTGGGSPQALVRIATAELIKANGGMVCQIRM
ncbi:YbaK/EbsC family protein [Candidatus Micrarchaeota archaeon]|nr:YbaK/EbsC family protein [Candidatus Micrarchaeota archaeon]